MRGERPAVRAPEASFQAEFEASLAVHLPPIFSGALLGEVQSILETIPCRPLDHGPLGVDYSLDFGPLVALLQYLMTDDALLLWVEQGIGVSRGSLETFSGRIYEMTPERGEDSWHKDMHPEQARVVALSMSLTDHPMEGGATSLRHVGSTEPFWHSRCVARGESVAFRLSKHLEHQANRVSKGRRLNLAGWFFANASFDYERWISDTLKSGVSKGS